jgi:hypothetical protein
MVITVLGSLIMLVVLTRVSIFGRDWGIHAEIGGSLLVVLGIQVLALGLCARAYGVYFMGERDDWFGRMRKTIKLEHGLLVGGAIMLAGLVFGGIMVGIWIDRGFGSLAEGQLAVLSATLVTVGAEVFFTSFMLSILGLRRPE